MASLANPTNRTNLTNPTNLSFLSLVQLARDFSPRVETHGALRQALGAPSVSRGDHVVTLDVSGLGSLIGEPRAIGEELRRAAADAGLRVHVAVAATSTAAILLAHGRAGLTVVAPGDEARAIAPLPIDLLDRLGLSASIVFDQLQSRLLLDVIPSSTFSTDRRCFTRHRARATGIDRAGVGGD